MTELAGVGASFNEGGVPGRMYGPQIGGSPDDDRDSYYRPGGRLAPRGIAVPAAPTAPVQLAEYNPDRKTMTVANPFGPTVWVGDDPNLQPGPNSGANSFPLVAGATIEFEDREYIGPLYATSPTGSPTVTVYITETFAS